MKNQRVIQSGRLLLSEPFLHDPHFNRSVVLISDHRVGGTVGFILNKPTEIQTEDVLPVRLPLNFTCFYGGPVENDTLHFVHCSPIAISGSIPIVPGLFRGGNLEQVQSLFQKGLLKTEWFRFFIGYSGWEEGQLQEEVDEGAWLFSDMADTHILEEKTDQFWNRKIRHLGPDYFPFANAPIYPEWN